MTQFTQRAEGVFTFRQRPNTPHCGPSAANWPTEAVATYDVRVTMPESALDSNGFMLDNTWFAEYFAAFKDAQISISCECFARLIADDIARTANRTCEIHVTLEAVRGVKVTAHVTRQCEITTNDPVASKRQDILAGR